MTGPDVVLVLVGRRGLFAGVRSEVRLGQQVTVGRSRFVELSAVRTPAARQIGRDKLERSNTFRRMSRRHFQVTYAAPDRVVVADLSKNGVVVDGCRAPETIVNPAALPAEGASIRFGAGEELVLRVCGGDSSIGSPAEPPTVAERGPCFNNPA